MIDEGRLTYALDLLDHIPRVERIALSLHLSGASLREIAAQSDVRYVAVHYRIRRGLVRLRFLAHWQGTHLLESELYDALRRHQLPHQQAIVLATTLRTTSLAATQRQLRSTRRFVHYHWRQGLRTLQRLEPESDEIAFYHHVFADLRQHLCVLAGRYERAA